MKFPRPFLVSAIAAATLAAASAGASAQQEDFTVQVEPDPISDEVLDPIVYATLMPNPDVADPQRMQSAIAAAMAMRDPQPKPIVPITAPTDRSAPRPVRLDPNAGAAPTKLVLDSNQVVQIHADGMPTPNAPDADPLVRVMPRAANPADVTVGARWSTEDRIQAPLLSQLAWDAHADVVSGAPPARAANVRHSLRITAMWDDPEDLSIGFTPGWQRGGGMAFEHYVAGVEVSSIDKTKTARWHSYVELSGEKLAINNLPGIIDNATAHVAAGASYAASSNTQLDIAVSRGTTWTSSDLQSSVGLSVHF